MSTSLARTDLTDSADEAFVQASRSAIERAKRHKTHLVVWKDGDVYEIPYEELDSISLNGKQPQSSRPLT
jgi:hypothetical protein